MISGTIDAPLTRLESGAYLNRTGNTGKLKTTRRPRVSQVAGWDIAK